MELSCVSLVLNFGRCSLVLQVSELVLSVFLARSGLVFVIKWGNKAANVLVVDWNTGFFCKRLAVKILRLNLGNVAGVTWNMLSFDILSRATKPVFTVLRLITILQRFVCIILSWGVWVQFSLSELGLALSDVDIVVRWLVAGLGNDAVNVACSAAVDIILARDKTSVAGKVLLVVGSFFRHFY